MGGVAVPPQSWTGTLEEGLYLQCRCVHVCLECLLRQGSDQHSARVCIAHMHVHVDIHWRKIIQWYPPADCAVRDLDALGSKKCGVCVWQPRRSFTR